MQDLPFLAGTPVPETLAEAEADLLRSLNHGTAGGTLPEVTGMRLDGVEELLSDYRGRIVLLDFPVSADARPLSPLSAATSSSALSGRKVRMQ